MESLESPGLQAPRETITIVNVRAIVGFLTKSLKTAIRLDGAMRIVNCDTSHTTTVAKSKSVSSDARGGAQTLRDSSNGIESKKRA